MLKPMKPNDFGKKFLVEECQKISISVLVKQANNRLKETLISSDIEASGLKLELTTSLVHFGGVRYWFKCPLCQKRVWTVFVHPLNAQIGCRVCLGLCYRKQRFNGMLEGSA